MHPMHDHTTQNALEEVVELSDLVELTPLPASNASTSSSEQPGSETALLPSPAALLAEARRLAAALAAVEASYTPPPPSSGSSDEEQPPSLVARVAGAGKEKGMAVGQRRRWMTKLLAAVAPRGKLGMVS